MRSDIDALDQAKLHRSRSWLMTAISIVQLVSSVITLYTRRGAQIERYGYAAYGLSVTPYALMTAVSLICNAIVGDWPCRCVLRPAICEDAGHREGAELPAAAGVPKRLEEGGAGLQDGYELADISIQASGHPEPCVDHKTLVVQAKGITRNNKKMQGWPCSGRHGLRAIRGRGFE